MLAATVAGTIPSWILVALALFVAWRVSKGGAGSAVSELTAANRVLEASLKEARLEVAALQTKLARLEGQTNVAIAMSPILDWTQMHERRAHERHAALIVVLDLIAERLGPDPNGHPA